jgi:hypothetical protein
VVERIEQHAAQKKPGTHVTNEGNQGDNDKKTQATGYFKRNQGIYAVEHHVYDVSRNDNRAEYKQPLQERTEQYGGYAAHFF